MTAKVLLPIWRAIHRAPWVLAETAVRFGGSTALVILTGWALFGGATICWILGTLAVLMILALGGDARGTLASSLLNTIKFAARRTRIRLTWRAAMNRAKLFEVEHLATAAPGASLQGGRKYPRLKRWGRCMIERTPCGMILTVDGSRIGADSDAFTAAQALVLSSKWRTVDYGVERHPRWPHMTRLRLLYVDPFAGLIRPSDLLTTTPKPGRVRVGKDSDGKVVQKDIRLAHLLVGGLGSGKSSECWQILGELIRLEIPFRVRVYDPKGGMEFSDLNGRAYRYESNPTAWCDFLTEALAALAQRQQAMQDAGVGRKWKPGDPRFPLDVMVIDELVTVIAMMAGAKNTVKINGKDVQAIKAFLVYLSQIRAAGFTVVACTQLSQKEAIGLLRDLFAYITCLRVGSDEMVKTVLGDSKLYPAHLIPPGDDHAGIGYMSTDRGPLKYRSAYNDDDERAAMARTIGTMSEGYWLADKQGTSSKGITLAGLESKDLVLTQEDAAVIEAAVQICQQCQNEFIPDHNELAMNGASA